MRITEQSGVVLAQSIRAGTISARAVVDAHIELLERVHPALNAVAADRYRQARLDADSADARIADGDPATLPPLLGVPVTVKESIAVAGMPHSAGVVARKHLRPDIHATVVQRLVDAGAIEKAALSEIPRRAHLNARNHGVRADPENPG
ncbi:amidase family protein, partial [Nocardia tengchongensis]|uniref:amidase family protein n=1 Tax=Nocardia tengchongensis TaxID=2055889 RepID=UPI00367DDCD4